VALRLGLASVWNYAPFGFGISDTAHFSKSKKIHYPISRGLGK